MTNVAVAIQVYALTGSSFYVGLVGLFALVPLVAFGLYGGAIADARGPALAGAAGLRRALGRLGRCWRSRRCWASRASGCSTG